MRFSVSILPEAAQLLPRVLQFKLARRAARKVLRMGNTSATIIFPGPDDLRVVVNCLKRTIVITRTPEALRSSPSKSYRRSA
jgi:hypothetical protein